MKKILALVLVLCLTLAYGSAAFAESEEPVELIVFAAASAASLLLLALATLADRQKRESLDEALKRRSFELLPAGGLAARTRARVALVTA